MAGKLTEEQRLEIVRRYQDGSSIRALGEIYHLSSYCIRNILVEEGCKIRGNREAQLARSKRSRRIDLNSFGPQKWRQIYMGPEKPSMRTLANRYGCDRVIIWRHLNRHNIPIRSASEQQRIDLRLGHRSCNARNPNRKLNLRKGWHPGLVSEKAKRKRARTLDTSVELACDWCGASLKRDKNEVLKYKHFFCCVDHHCLWQRKMASAPKPIVVVSEAKSARRRQQRTVKPEEIGALGEALLRAQREAENAP